MVLTLLKKFTDYAAALGWLVVGMIILGFMAIGDAIGGRERRPGRRA